MERLIQPVRGAGQSPWLDNLTRGYLTTGQLAQLRDGGIRGLTSNPTIFQKAIEGSTDYDEQFRDLARDDAAIIDDYWELVLQDITRRARRLRAAVRGRRRRRRLRERRGRPGPGPRHRRAPSPPPATSTRRSPGPT